MRLSNSDHLASGMTYVRTEKASSSNSQTEEEKPAEDPTSLHGKDEKTNRLKIRELANDVEETAATFSTQQNKH